MVYLPDPMAPWQRVLCLRMAFMKTYAFIANREQKRLLRRFINIRAARPHFGSLSDTTYITFNWDASNAPPGKHILKASIDTVEGEEDVADNTMAKTINIKAPD